jgi:lycopene beta-cyclase
MAERFDLVLAGGGLAAGLIAWRMAVAHPDVRVAVVEREGRLGGRHTWSFFDTDLTPKQRAWIAPAVVRHWDCYDVAFPERRRTLGVGYNSISSDRFHQVVSDFLGDRLIQGEIASVSCDAVALSDGRRLEGGVIDARGPEPTEQLSLGWQKFVGRELRLAEPHGLERPIIMDATVDQLDGYRFLYVLPFSADVVLVEDTRYSDGADLDREALRAGVEAYCADQGWTIAEVLREEEGVLPIALDGDIEGFLDDGAPGVARAGLRAALFHPTTGYSLPDAVRVADRVADLSDFSGPALHTALRRHAVETWRSRGFYRLLDRMLFRACAPDQRYRVLERFYGLSEGLIGRFYADRLTFTDKARILAGKPPVPVSAALKQLTERRAA